MPFVCFFCLWRVEVQTTNIVYLSNIQVIAQIKGKLFDNRLKIGYKHGVLVGKNWVTSEKSPEWVLK